MWKGLGSLVIDVSVKKNSFFVYVLNIFFRILAGRCGSVVVRKRDKDTKGPGSTPELRISFFLIKTLSIKGQKFSKCLKNGSDPLRKGTTAVANFSFAYFLG